MRAFELVRAQRPDAQLMIVGDWQRYPRIKKLLAGARDTSGLMLPGEQPRESLGAFYAMADVFAFPSLTDTQALVLHEAALAGLPIVAVDHELQLVLEPGVNGELGRPTAASFAAAILRVLDRNEAWRENASKRSVELASQWTVASQAEEMLRLYEQVAAGLATTATDRRLDAS